MEDQYKINLSETNLNNLFGDYVDVEGVIEKIVDQAKIQGYEPPEQYEEG